MAYSIFSLRVVKTNSDNTASATLHYENRRRLPNDDKRRRDYQRYPAGSDFLRRIEPSYYPSNEIVLEKWLTFRYIVRVIQAILNRNRILPSFPSSLHMTVICKLYICQDTYGVPTAHKGICYI